MIAPATKVRSRARRSPERAQRPPAQAPSAGLSLADMFTLTNAACGFLAICSIAALFQHTPPAVGTVPVRLPSTAVMLLFLGATCDLFDGQIARRFGGSVMGAHLDNLADAISFGLAPAFLVAVWGTHAATAPAERVIAIVAATCCMLAVLVRLARFAAVPAAKCTFMGLPCPMGALTIVAIVLLDPPVPVAAGAIVAVAVLMVSRITYPKPQGVSALLVLAWLVVSVLALAAYSLGLPGAERMVLAGAGLQVLLTVCVPLGVRRTRTA